MQKITNIEIKNFKSIRHAEIKDCRKVNVFIGYPNVGKSNILEGLGLYSIRDVDSDFLNFARMGAPTTLFFDGDISQKIEIKINHKHRIIGKFENYHISFSRQFEREGTYFDRFDNGNIVTDTTSSIGICSNFKVSNQNSLNKILDYLIGNYSLKIEDRLNPVKRYSFLKEVLYGGDNSYLELIYPHGNNLFNVILANKILKKEIEGLFEQYNLKFSYDTSKQGYVILKFIGSDIFSIPYSLVADTLQRLIFYKAAIQSNKNSILLFEEPEAHMFPPYIRKMTSDIVFDKNDNQYFIATHSPYVLDELMAEVSNELSVYLVDYKDGETRIIHLSEDELKEIREYGVDLFFNIESYLKNGQINNA